MRRIIIIAGLVVCAVFVEGVVFFLSSRATGEAAGSGTEEVAPPPPTDFDELLVSARECREQRRFKTAEGFVRLALDCAKTPEERSEAGYRMGCLLFEDYRQGGDSELDAAALYLEAAYTASDNSRKQALIGQVLLDVLQEAGETEQFSAYLDEMLSSTDSQERLIELWRRKFKHMLDCSFDWQEMNDILVKAETLPLQSGEWSRLVEDTRLRIGEKLLADREWFERYARFAGIKDPVAHRQKLFSDVRSELEEILENGDASEREGVLLRMASLFAAIGNYEQASRYLEMFLAMEPTENLPDALMLMSRISRVRGDVAHVTQLAQALIRRFDFNVHTQDEVLQVVELLEEHELYDDALGLLEGCFSLVESPGKELGRLLGKAAVLEERLGHRANALNYMHQLLNLGDDRFFDDTFSSLVEVNVDSSNYEAVESWVQRYGSRLKPNSEICKNALFSLFDAKFWLDRPVLEQLFIGFSAIQAAPEDVRTAFVELRMARYLEDMKLNELAVSYYNRIGLLNFFQGESFDSAYNQSIGEQAMLGKARCLKKLGDWVSADHLYRELCNRTKSPLIKSAAAVGWGEMALRFGQNREAERRYGLAHVQMLSEADQVRYSLGHSRLEGEKRFLDASALEDGLALLDSLPPEERRNATVEFFNDSFEFLHRAGDERAMERMIDLACQSDYSKWLPVLGYVLQMHENDFQREKLAGVGDSLRGKDELGGAYMLDLAQTVDRLEGLATMVQRHKRKEIQ